MKTASDGRLPNGRFGPGNPGGPGRGAAKKTSPLALALESLAKERKSVTDLTRVVRQKLEAGDPNFWKLFADRVWPAVQKIEDVTPLAPQELEMDAEEAAEFELEMRGGAMLQ